MILLPLQTRRSPVGITFHGTRTRLRGGSQILLQPPSANTDLHLLL